MKNFEDRKKDYLKKINENSEIVESIVNNPSSNQRMIEIILNPQTEKELEIADSVITYFSDLFNIAYRKIKSGNVNFEDNSYITIVSNLIIAIKNKNEEKVKEINDYLDGLTDPALAARFIFDFYSGFCGDPEGCYEYVAQKAGFDISDFRQRELYNLYWNKIQEVTKKERKENIDFSSDDLEKNEQVDATIRVMKEFHRLYENEINKGNSLK